MWLLAGLLACSGSEAPEGGAVAGGPPPAPPEGVPLVKIGANGVVTEEEFAAVASRAPAEEGGLTLEQRKEILDRLVTDEVLFQKAYDAGMYRDPKVRKIMVNLLLREQVYEQLKAAEITDEEAQAFFTAHIAEFRMPEKAQVKRIFIGYGDGVRSQEEAEKLAQDLRSQLVKDPTKFRALAEQYSEDSYKRRAGDMGYIDNVPDSPHPPELLQQAFSLEIGRLSEAFVAGGGYNLVVVAAKREAVERTFEQMKGTVLRRMKSERLQELTKKYTEEQRAAVQVVIDDQQLMAVKVDPKLAPPPESPDLEAEIGVGPDGEPIGPRGGRASPGRQNGRIPGMQDKLKEIQP